jgi:hypothetical protein
MVQKLKSRKLWAAVLAAVAQVALPAFGVPPEAVDWIAKLAGFYIGAEGAVDAARAFKA